MSAQTTWTGAVSTDWFVPGNWSDGIPDANDDVTISTSANNPVIATTTAVANSILVESGTTLTIDASGTLNVDLLSSAVTNFPVRVFGTMNNSGTVTIGAATSAGDRGLVIGQVSPVEPGIFNNLTGAVLQIDNFSFIGIALSNTVGNSFVNDGTVEIGITAGSSHGIFGENGTFENNTDGVITMDNLTGNGLWLFQNFTFNNNGTINSGLDSMSAGSFAIDTRGTFNNLSGGIIDIFGFTNRGIYNNSGTDMAFPAEFNNSGSIFLNGQAAASVGAYGIVVQGQYATFNNLSSGTIEITDVTTIGVAAGFAGANDFGSVFNNSGDITTQGIDEIPNQGIRCWEGTFNHDAGTITIDNVSIPISISAAPSFFDNSSTIITQNLPFATTNIVSSPEGQFVHNTGGLINGFGQINAGDFTNSGGAFTPGEPYGIIRFNGNADLSNATINIDVNGSSAAGTDYDKIENNPFGDDTITIGGVLNLNITFSPTTDLEYITIIEAGSEVIGEFSTVNGLPPLEWELLYNFPSSGDVTLEFGAINSIQSGAFSDPSTWADGVVPDLNRPAVVEDGHVVTLDTGQSFEVARLQISETASVVVPESSSLVVNASMGTSIINSGNLDLGGTIDINDSSSIGIDNEGTISVTGTATTTAVVDISNSGTTAFVNSGTLNINDFATVNINGAMVGLETSGFIDISLDGLLDIDFTTESGIITESGSEFYNNGQTLIGRDPSATNTTGLYGIDHLGYFITSATGLLEIEGASDTQILMPSVSTTRQGTLDGQFGNEGESSVFGQQTNAVEQGDNPTAVKGKYKHVLKKRPTPNPGRSNSSNSQFFNQILSLLRGDGIVESDITFLNGGIISPGFTNGDEGILVFDGDEDFSNVTLKIDVNGKTLKGTDYDLIALIGTTTLGGELDVDITYTPEIGDIITFIESDDVIDIFDEPILPANWNIRYNYPNQGDVSLEFGVLSIDDNGLDTIKIYSDSKSESIVIYGNLPAPTEVELYDITGRLILNKGLELSTNYNPINVAKIASGTYIVKLKSDSNSERTQKIIIN
ncbi:beta strand repeat-containing protein [Winogradskyella tangerina]|uniref:beta strand repeat-containing protein n=1 Tax=Winogradskyella tangerina TaxID=2023240 RepID=UPI001300A463|nr:T9SS type A sorting domain-containing protein [Winogradskyella tangerina]